MTGVMEWEVVESVAVRLQGQQKSCIVATYFFCDLLPVWAVEVAREFTGGCFCLVFEPRGLPLRVPMF